MRVLMLVPSRLKTGLDAQVASDAHPTMDYHALAARLRAGGDTVEMLDFAALEASRHPLVRLARRAAGDDPALALLGFLRRGGCDAVFTNSESVGIPLALLFKPLARRPRHVTIGHRLSTGKKHLFFRVLGAHRQIDTILVYADLQRRIAAERLGIPPNRLSHIEFHADTAFYRPRPDIAEDPDQICAAGLEWRDYPTLIDAVADTPDLKVRLAAASPWSKHANETEKRALPEHVQARRYEYGELRELYARSFAVAVPLYENDFQAGITSLLEAMAMGKAVIVTRTQGQTDVVIDGETGLYVAPGDAAGWRAAIARLREDPALRRRLGENARVWVERHASLDLWARQIAGALHGAAPARVSGKEVAVSGVG